MKLTNIGKLMFASAIILLLGSWNTASADIVFSVEVDPPVNAGDTATVSFFASSDVAGGQALSGFNLPIDFGNDGNGISGGFSIPDPSIPGDPANPINAINGNASLNSAALQNSLAGSDTIVNLSNGSLFTIGSAPTFLFDLLINTPANATVGSFPVSIADDSGFFSVTAADNTILSGTSSADPAGGSVNIVATIPEPTSTVLLVAGLAGVAMRRKRI